MLKPKQTLTLSCALIALIASAVLLTLPAVVQAEAVGKEPLKIAAHENDPNFAQCPGNNVTAPAVPPENCPPEHSTLGRGGPDDPKDNCGGYETSVDFGCVDGGDDPIAALITAIIKFLAVGVGLVVVVMIIVSGIQYVTSAGNPEGTAKAKKKLTNAIIGLLMFIFMAAILNFLVPGGLL